MKVLIIITLCAVIASALENYDAPEWQPVDWSKVVPAAELRKGANKFNIDTLKSRIVGGHEAVPHSHPYMVQLLVTLPTSVSGCGGTVITTTAILTAAHCIMFANIQSALVIAGAHNVQLIETTQQRRTVQPSHFRMHPDFYVTEVLNDIATLLITNPFVFNTYVQPSRLAPANSPSFVGFESIATGWGRTREDGTLSPVLNYVNNTILSNAFCEGIYWYPAINENTVCIDSSGGRGVCSGDSGGPLTVVHEGQRVQIGIASFVGWLGCKGGLPHVFERIPGHLTWINNNIS